MRKMTSLNAAKLGLRDRGLLRPGKFADITIFDPDTVIDRSTYIEPFQYSEGIEYVIVNGQLVLDHGQHTRRPARAEHCAARIVNHFAFPASFSATAPRRTSCRDWPDLARQYRAPCRDRRWCE